MLGTVTPGACLHELSSSKPETIQHLRIRNVQRLHPLSNLSRSLWPTGSYRMKRFASGLPKLSRPRSVIEHIASAPNGLILGSASITQCQCLQSQRRHASSKPSRPRTAIFFPGMLDWSYIILSHIALYQSPAGIDL